MIRLGTQMNLNNKKYEVSDRAQRVRHVQTLGSWTKLLPTFLSLLLSHLKQPLVGSARYFLRKVITLLETVDSALGLWRKEFCCGQQVLQMLISVE